MFFMAIVALSSQQLTISPTRKGRPKVDSTVLENTVAPQCNDRLLFVTDFHLDNIFFGRGASMVHNEGNIRFRELTRSRQDEFCSAPRRKRKSEITRKILETIQRRRGRFWRKLESAEVAQRLGVPRGSDAWVALDDDQAIVNIKQALRHKEISKSPTPTYVESRDEPIRDALPDIRRNTSFHSLQECRQQRNSSFSCNATICSCKSSSSKCANDKSCASGWHCSH
jgi:hypothetical protein